MAQTQEFRGVTRCIYRTPEISYAEIAELQSLAQHIDPGDVELLEAAGVPEHTT